MTGGEPEGPDEPPEGPSAPNEPISTADLSDHFEELFGGKFPTPSEQTHWALEQIDSQLAAWREEQADKPDLTKIELELLRIRIGTADIVAATAFLAFFAFTSVLSYASEGELTVLNTGLCAVVSFIVAAAASRRISMR